jgi:hypothetical protein
VNQPVKFPKEFIIPTKNGDSVDITETLGDMRKQLEAKISRESKNVAKAVGAELGELERKVLDRHKAAQRDLQEQLDHLRDVQRGRETDWFDDLVELRRTVNRMSVEIEELKGKSRG